MTSVEGEHEMRENSLLPPIAPFMKTTFNVDSIFTFRRFYGFGRFNLTLNAGFFTHMQLILLCGKSLKFKFYSLLYLKI